MDEISHRLRTPGVEEYAYHINKLHQNVSLET